MSTYWHFSSKFVHKLNNENKYSPYCVKYHAHRSFEKKCWWSCYCNNEIRLKWSIMTLVISSYNLFLPLLLKQLRDSKMLCYSGMHDSCWITCLRKFLSSLCYHQWLLRTVLLTLDPAWDLFSFIYFYLFIIGKRNVWLDQRIKVSDWLNAFARHLRYWLCYTVQPVYL